MIATGGTEVLSTKISTSAGEALRRAAERLHTNRYTLLQTFIDCLLRFIDDWGSASQDLRSLMQILVGNFNYLLRQTSICTSKESPIELSSSIMFLHEKGKDPQLQTAVWVKDQKMMGACESNYNVQHMFDKFMKVALPYQYHKLQEVARDNDMSSTVEALNYILLTNEGETELEASVKALFLDNDRLQFGQKAIQYDKKYKDHKHYNVDTAHVNRNNGKRPNISQTDLFASMEETEE